MLIAVAGLSESTNNVLDLLALQRSSATSRWVGQEETRVHWLEAPPTSMAVNERTTLQQQSLQLPNKAAMCQR